MSLSLGMRQNLSKKLLKENLPYLNGLNHVVAKKRIQNDIPKGPSTHGEEFADEYSTNIRRRIFYPKLKKKIENLRKPSNKSKNLTKMEFRKKN